jgi:hypothetical protein
MENVDADVSKKNKKKRKKKKRKLMDVTNHRRHT